MADQPAHGSTFSTVLVAHPLCVIVMKTRSESALKTCLMCLSPITSKKSKIYCCIACASMWRAMCDREKTKLTCIDIFWSKVTKTDDCWFWNGGSNGNGYGKMIAPYLLYRPRAMRRDFVHRISFWLANGRLPNGITRHTCDNRMCVNPSHLLEGSYQDNVDDMISRKRMCIGESRKQSKLTDELVKKIRSSSMSGREIARKLGLSESTIRFARSAKTWKHVSL
jgi:hypothetical protein